MHYRWLRLLGLVATFYGIYWVIKARILWVVVVDIQWLMSGGTVPFWAQGAIVAMLAAIVLLIAVVCLAFTEKKSS